MSDERLLRFGYLLSQIELSMKAILAGREHDVPLALLRVQVDLDEAREIMGEISREALDEVMRG